MLKIGSDYFFLLSMDLWTPKIVHFLNNATLVCLQNLMMGGGGGGGGGVQSLSISSPAPASPRPVRIR